VKVLGRAFRSPATTRLVGDQARRKGKRAGSPPFCQEGSRKGGKKERSSTPIWKKKMHWVLNEEMGLRKGGEKEKRKGLSLSDRGKRWSGFGQAREGEEAL